MKRVCSMVSGAVAVIGLAAAIGLVAGCEWESSGESNSWSDAFNWVNFSGTYRSSTSGILVSAYTQKVTTSVETSTSTKSGNTSDASSSTSGSNSSKTSSKSEGSNSSSSQSDTSSSSQNDTSSSGHNNTSSDSTDAVQVTTNTCSESLGTLSARSLAAAGSLKHKPIVPGSVVIRVGSDVVVSDNASGKLTGSGLKEEGAISYDGGGWGFTLADTLWSTDARPITATYAYTVTTRGPATQSDTSEGGTSGSSSSSGRNSENSSGQNSASSSGESNESTSGSNNASASESSRGNNTTSTTTTYDDGKRAGSTGGAIYMLIVVQEGQHLTITDNNGGTYKGRIGTLRSSSGSTPENSNSTGNGAKVMPKNGDTIVATFNCKGTSAAGMAVTITGTLSGTVSSRSSVDPGIFINRQMQGTWVEAGGKTGDINGTTDSISIPKTEDSTWQWDMLPSENRWPAGTEPGTSVYETPSSQQSGSSSGTSTASGLLSSSSSNSSSSNSSSGNSSSGNSSSSNTSSGNNNSNMASTNSSL